MLFPCNVLFKQRSQFNEAPFSFHTAWGALPGMGPTSGLTGSAHGCDHGAPAIVICFLGHGGYVSYRQNSSMVFAIFLATGAWRHLSTTLLPKFFRFLLFLLTKLRIELTADTEHVCCGKKIVRYVFDKYALVVSHFFVFLGCGKLLPPYCSQVCNVCGSNSVVSYFFVTSHTTLCPLFPAAALLDIWNTLF